MKPKFGNIMKQAKEMQEKLKAEQDKLAMQEIHGEAGAGLVKIVLTGKHDAKSISIDPSLVTGLSEEDQETLRDLVCAAINDANRKIEGSSQNMLSNLAGGIDMSDLGDIFKQ